MARASANAARAQLTELLRGTRPEQLEQAEAALAGAQAKVQQLEITRERLDVRAVRSGRVDALPFRLGDQPPVGATLVSLLAGDAPYARVYVPERLRASTQPGQHFRVRVDGVDKPFDAVLRSIRSDPAFTPYYALSGDDATRLSYRAELVLQGDAVHALPAGLPCHAWPDPPLWHAHCRRSSRSQRAPRRGVWLPRPQWLRQIDHYPHAVWLAAAQRR
jgi:HlyD family secretion protein